MEIPKKSKIIHRNPKKSEEISRRFKISQEILGDSKEIRKSFKEILRFAKSQKSRTDFSVVIYPSIQTIQQQHIFQDSAMQRNKINFTCSKEQITTIISIYTIYFKANQQNFLTNSSFEYLILFLHSTSHVLLIYILRNSNQRS